MILELIVLFCILIYALFDLKEKAVPAFMTTALILALLIINSQNLIWGIAGFVFGWLLYEFDFSGGQYVGGLADVKVLAIIGMMISNLATFASMMVMLSGFGVIAAVVRHFYYKGKEPKEFPFIPVLLLVYCGVLVVQQFV